MIARISLVVLSSLLLAAHFFREGNMLLVAGFLLLPLLLFVRRRWILSLLQVLLYLGAIVWLQTALSFITERRATGDDWLRLALILFAVATVTAVAGILLNNEVIRKRYTGKNGTTR